MARSSQHPPQPAPIRHAVHVYAGEQFRVIDGANAGDALPLPADSIAGDYYRLADGAQPAQMLLDLVAPPGAHQPPVAALSSGQGPGGAGRIAAGSALGQPGEAVALHGRLSLMAPDGDLVELLVLQAASAGRLALPLSPLRARLTYTLIAADAAPGPLRLAETVAGAFARGTRIALGDGRQHPVEDLQPGDSIITRDTGLQPLRWIGSVRLRAEGGFAPVSFLPGAMGNPRALTVSPHHRMFLYRPDARPVAGATELLVQARHLVDGRMVLRREGGFVEYFSLVFDHHEVIYAEGLPCESLMVCPQTLFRLPADLADPLGRAFPGLNQRLHHGADIATAIVSRLRDEPALSPAPATAQAASIARNQDRQS
ncbi:MAG: Hint domain-containing protein [Pararhodobacter sp.]